MNSAQLLEHFDRICEAPDAVARMRRFILDLAVRGKLVEQDLNDEPAAELLKRIQAEKVQLVKKGKAKKEKPLAPIEADEAPFSVPASWTWTRLQDITSYIQRGKSPAYATEDGFPVVSQKCVQWRGFDLSAARLITKESISKYEDVRFLRENDLLWNSTGTGTIGRVVKVISPPENLVCDSHVTVVRCALADPEYVRSWLRCDHVYLLIEDRAAGSTNQVELTAQMATAQVVPIPPLAEQHRIVVKVDELMALCDQLEAAKNEREARRDRLVAASLHRIGTAPAAADEAATETQSATPLRDAACFHLDHLPRLTTRPEHIKQLRQTILNLAVRGRLVPQEPNDEPVAELLKRIQAEKAQLVKGGRLKKDKQFWDGLPKMPSYEIPENWTWIQLQDAFEISRGGSPRPAGDPLYFGGSIPWITVREITKDDGKFLTKTETGLTELGATKSRFIDPGDLLLTNSGATLGVPKISQIRGCMNDGVAVLRQFHGVNLNDFAYLYLQSQTEAFRQINQGMGQPNLNTPIIAGWFFPLPPLAEQHRIVAKVDELMALCDQLEAQLTATQNDSRRLLNAVLHVALAAAA